MGVFNLLETVFFLSLAITFILIFMLVNHFKQRLNTIENKCNTMFEIINNMVQEFSMLKHMQMSSYKNGFIPQPPLVSKSEPEICTNNVRDANDIKSDKSNKIIVSDDDPETSDEDYSDYESDYESHEDSSRDENRDEDSDTENEHSKIKIVNMDIKDTIDIDDLREEIFPDTLEEELIESPLEDFHQENNTISRVDKLDKIVNDITEEIVNKTFDYVKEDAKEVYNKMSVQELKKTVITKGLCSDPSKLKKNELLKMLESSLE